ncbi:MAG: ABC transporter ATP-binding protein [Acidobacteria bacterium]|nr:MAG: ABC transporter ATP-binding protein [Acidobacteriota bacterium]
MPDPAIEFREVTFARPPALPVLDRFRLTVEAGEVVAMVGRSGAGKTTLLKLVNRLLLPQAGAVLVQGRDTRDWEPIQLRRRIGYVLQEVGLFPHMTVGGNVSVVPRLERWPPERVDRRVSELLELVGLNAQQFGPRWPDELSGGQRQRVGVARALAVDPPVLLMDEPFGALDPLTRAELHAEFRRIQSRVRKTVIIVTHDMGEAFALGDRVGVLDEGHLVTCDLPHRVAASNDIRVRRLLDALPSVPRAHTDAAAAEHPSESGRTASAPPGDGR